MEYYKNLLLENIKYFDENGVECIEEWRSVVGYERLYEVSNLGRMKTLERNYGKSPLGKDRIYSEKILKQALNNGYLCVTLYGFDKLLRNNPTPTGVHRYVGIAFIPNPKNKPEINHTKGIRTDNRVTELEWVTHSENGLHAYKNGFIIPTNGILNGNCSFTEKEILEIANSSLLNTELAIKYNTSRPNISMIKTGRNWSHITGIKYKNKYIVLSDEKVLQIYNSKLSNKELAIKYGIPIERVSRIKHKIYYKKLLDAV